MNIFTIGYEGAEFKSFIALLQSHRIDAVADVRYSPYSRKKGFSKGDLREALVENGIAYIGCPLLGVPRDIRDMVKTTGDYGRFFKMYRELLQTKGSQINELVAMIKGGKRIALLCFESDPEKCHRRVLAEKIGELIKNNFEVIHLVPS